MSSRASRRRSKVDAYHMFLESLQGKTVTVYRGGPESKTGTLLGVGSDFIALLNQNNNNNNNDDNNQNNNNENNNNQNENQNTVVYYHIKHVKSVSEDSKSNSMQMYEAENNDVEFIQAEDFTGVVEQLGGKYIQINQGGPESKTGLVVNVIDDYIVLLTDDDGIVYFNVDHVKSIYEYNNNNNNDQSQNNQQNQSEVIIPSYDEGRNFSDLFGHMTHKWVSINRGGPEAIEGVLVESSGGHYTLVSNEEVLRINPYHIRSISSGSKGSLNNNNQNNDNQNTEQQSEEVENNSTEHVSNENKEHSSSRRRSSRRISRETVVKTIDYNWVPK